MSSVITDISGKSGMTILKAIVSGETDPVVLSELAEGRARDKIPEMQKIPYKDGYQNISKKC